MAAKPADRGGPARRQTPSSRLRHLLPAALPVEEVRQRIAPLPWRRLLIALAVLLTVFAAGIGLYIDERTTRQEDLTVGAAAVADRVDIGATIHKTDPDSRRVTLRISADPQGRYADGGGAPTKDLTLVTNSPDQENLTFKAGSASRLRDLTVPLREGTVSDYPFDRYAVTLVVGATVGANPVPVTLRFRDQDPYFVIKPHGSVYDGRVAYVDGQVKRSRSTFIMSAFMMAAMWAIALSVVVACWLVVGQRRGLVWPALGWMAASLFALVGLRNAAPGSPPNGCVLDYAAFYWAEALIALSLARLVFHGIHIEHRSGGPIPPPGDSAQRTVRLRRRGVPAGGPA
ncbi:DUF4436 family protein, partial [Streptomyces sp. T-3]|nr:DUF4436 family protein [Streptomyces sp. T-3]